MPICAPHARSERPWTPLPRRTAAAALTFTLIVASGCSRSGGTEVPSLPELRPVEVPSSAQPGAGARSDGALTAARGVVRRYYSALDGLRRHMRAAPLARLLTADCPCRAQVRAVRAAARQGRRYTDHVRLTSVLAHLDRPDLVDVVVSLDVSQGGLVDPAGRRTRPETTARNLHRELVLRRIADRWLIERVIAV